MTTLDEWVRHYTTGAGGISDPNIPPVQGLPDPSTFLPPGLVGPNGQLQLPGVSLPLGSPIGAFPWDQATGEKMLAAIGSSSSSAPLVMNATDFRQAMMTALVHAELAAGAAGIATPIPTGSDDPTKSIGFIIGGAYAKAKTMNTDVARAYVATFDAVQAATNAAQAADPSTPLTIGSDFLPTIAPVVAGLILVGIIATALAVAYIGQVKVRADAVATENVARCAMAVDLAKAGKPIPPGLIPGPTKPPGDPLGDLFSGSGASGLGVALAGVAIVTAVILLKK